MLSERSRDKDSRLHQGIELGVPNTEESEITNGANRYLLLKKLKTPLISFKSTFNLQVSRLNDAFHSPDGVHRKRPKRLRERKETKWMEITGAWENLVILEQLSISSNIVTLFALFALGPSLLYTNVSKTCSSKVNRLWK